MTNKERIEIINSYNGETEKVLVITEKSPKPVLNFVLGLNTLSLNRLISDAHVEEIEEAMSNGVYMPPIEVQVSNLGATSLWETMDGNHRLLAAQRCIRANKEFTLRLHIFHLNKKCITTTRIVNNTGIKWNTQDRLHSYCSEGKTHFLKLRKFMEEHSEACKDKNGRYRVDVALATLKGERKYPSLSKSFKNGTLKIEEKHLELGHTILLELDALNTILRTSEIVTNPFFCKNAIIQWQFFRKNYDFKEVKKKVTKYAHKWHLDGNSIEDWYTLFHNILAK